MALIGGALNAAELEHIIERALLQIMDVSPWTTCAPSWKARDFSNRAKAILRQYTEHGNEKFAVKTVKKRAPAKKVGVAKRKKKAVTKATARRGLAPVSQEVMDYESNGANGQAGSSTLVIVESPGKVKTIAKYLGRGYRVRATVGHIMDLPAKKLGVDVDKEAPIPRPRKDDR